MQNQIFLTAAQVRERYGHVSRMWLYRRMANSSFPAPVRFARFRYWRVSDLRRWESEMAAKSGPASLHRPAQHRAV